jgi:hypothetical protein
MPGGVAGAQPVTAAPYADFSLGTSRAAGLPALAITISSPLAAASTNREN